MRLPMIAPLLLLLAPSAGVPSAAEAVSETSTHTICADDTAVPAVERILPGYGAGALKILTSRPAAQAFFDNGLQLSHAFAHDAGRAAFKEAARIDPACAMCVWGEAWAGGPTINFTIDAATQVKMGKLIDGAIPLAATAPLLERQMLAALALRYKQGGGKGAGDLAYARAMDAIAVAHPDNDEILTLAADAWMIPAALGNDKQGMPRAVALLEAVLTRNPDFTPAIHFYIHATEMSGFPARAEKYADRLGALAPAASHLIHMPSHTYYWIGRYQAAADANVRAAALGVAETREAKPPAPDAETAAFKQPYHGHNVHFGVGGALISGDAKDALALSAPVLRGIPQGPTADPYVQMIGGTAYFAEGRFADPAAVLALPDPGEKVPFMRAYRHYARGEAYARLGNAAAVRAEAEAIPMVAGPTNKDDAGAQATSLMRIAKAVLIGRAAMLEKRYDLAARAYKTAAKIEEAKNMRGYDDPPIWWYPVRRSLAAALLASGNPKDALEQADAALARRPLDPLTLAVRADALAALGRADDAAKDRAVAAKGWHGDKALLAPALI